MTHAPATTPVSETTPETRLRRLVVIGNGMVGQRLVDAVRDRDAAHRWHITVLGEEPRAAYDRVALTSYLTGVSAAELSVVPDGCYDGEQRVLHLGDAAAGIDRAARTVTTVSGRVVGYDALVLATGSRPFVPPVPGTDLDGCFVYRTIEDLDAIRTRAAGARSGAVVGGGLLGLEAANALLALGVEAHVVEFAPRLMPAQVDEGGGMVLRRAIEDLGLTAHVGTATQRIERRDEAGSPGGAGTDIPTAAVSATDADAAGPDAEAARPAGGLRMVFADPPGSPSGSASGTAYGAVLGTASGLASGTAPDGVVDHLDVDLVVFSAGIRPRDELARGSGLDVGERGGIVVDPSCRTSDPAIWAVGECAQVNGRVHGLVAPGYSMAELVADQLVADQPVADAADDPGDVAARPPTFEDPDTSTKLKLLGVDVASFGDAHAATPNALEVVYADPVGGVYKKLVVTDDASRLLGGVLVGDASAYAALRTMVGQPLTDTPEQLLLVGPQTSGLEDAAQVCSCQNVTAGAIRCAITDDGCTDVAGVKACTRAGTVCGSCVPLIKNLLTQSGVETSTALCEHFEQSRAELFDVIRATGIRTFSELVGSHGTGRGCDICKPVVASILASLGAGHVLDGDRAGLQDTNDRYLANIQRDGTYSVVPRVPGGELTPAGLITIGEVARDFGLYTKITGGQRIDLLGARVEQLPAIWKRLVDAGFESGHAYGKALRTVKSCVGSTWCRYGVQDSTSLAIMLEMRYRGLRAPHKIKAGVSGCARECAEARSKDVGVIATENGWNLYVGGNGGFTPRHARLFASDLDVDRLVRLIDRFLMFYVRTADRLQRTAAWIEALDDEHGDGLAYLERVLVEDTLEICSDLDAALAHHVGSYADEWAAVLDDPQKLSRFVSFVNAPDVPDPSIRFETERGQIKPTAAVPVAGPTLEVVRA